MESQPQNPEFRNNPENFHPWMAQNKGGTQVTDFFLFVPQKYM